MRRRRGKVNEVSLSESGLRTLYIKFDEAVIEDALLAMLSSENHTPIEVPPEQYESVMHIFMNEGLCNSVPKDIIQCGRFTYIQAYIVAKNKLIDDLTLDGEAIHCKNTLGITFVIRYALSIWNNEGHTGALQNAKNQIDMPTPKLSTINFEVQKKKSKIGSPQDLARMAAPKTAQVLYNALRVGPRVIFRSAFELLRANTVTRFISAIVLLSIDTFSLIRGRISKKQYIINVSLALMLLVGGTAGWILGNHVISLVILENVILGILAGLVGAGVFGAAIGIFGERAVGRFVKDDTADMLDIINQDFVTLANDYLLNEKEIDDAKSLIEISKQHIKDMFIATDRLRFAQDIIEPYLVDVIKQRQFIILK